MLISVAICTWNRASLLDRTLEGLAQLVRPTDSDWEVVVVDNNSTDATADCLARWAGSGRLPLKPIKEARQGLSNARNRALAVAEGELIVWTDDDVVVEPGWLEAYRSAAKLFPEASYFGGPVRPDFEADPPDWVRRDLGLLGGPFALIDLGPEVRLLGPGDPPPIGANMAFRRSALGRHRFDPSIGRIGAGLLSGDETRLIEELVADGAAGAWVGTAAVAHHVPASRMNWPYLIEWFDRCAASYVKAVRPPGPDWFGVPRFLWRRWLEVHSAWLWCRVTGRGEPAAVRIERARLAGTIRECRAQASTRTDATGRRAAAGSAR